MALTAGGGGEGVPVWLRGKMCVTRNLEAPGSDPLDPLGFLFSGVSLRKILQSPGIVLVKPRKYMNM